MAKGRGGADARTTLMRAKGLSRFEESLQARENARPSLCILRIGWVNLRPMIVGPDDLDGFGFRRQLDPDAGH